MDRPEALARMVEARRVALGLTYRQLGTACGLAASSVHKIAHGKLRTMPQADTLDRLAKGLRLPREVLTEAVMADQGLWRTEIDEGKRKTIYISAGELTSEQLDVVQSVIDALRTQAGDSP